jgi:hypothetical protein
MNVSEIHIRGRQDQGVNNRLGMMSYRGKNMRRNRGGVVGRQSQMERLGCY